MITPLWIQVLAIIKRFLIQLRNNYISSFFVLVFWPAFYLAIAITIIIKNNFDDNNNGARFTLQTISYVLIFLLTGFGTKYFIEWLVKDRTYGFKSLMLLMGLRRSAYYLGNTITYTICLLPVLLTMFFISKVYVFNEITWLNMIIFYIIFTLQLNSQLFVCVSLITKMEYISFITLILILQMTMNYLLVMLMSFFGPASYSIILFFGSMFPYEAYCLFADSYTICGNDCNQIDLIAQSKASIPLHTLLIFMSFWSIIGFLFSRWFEEVNPWQNDTAVKGPFFFITKYINNQKSNSNDAVELTNQSKESEYFEEINTHNRDVGIKIKNLTKQFNAKPAVDDLSFDVFEGETTLLLGHNGAGKTTLMNIIIGKLASTSGRIEFKSNEDNKNFHHQEKRERSGNVGICPQFSILDAGLTVKQHLELFISIKAGSMNKLDREKHIIETLEDVSLIDELDKKPNELSGGMMRKLSLAIAFVGQSDILILDEPSSGLDPDSRIYVWNAIRKYRKNRTVLLSTQHMEEADYLGDRIAIMSNGKIICCGSSIFLINTLGNCYKLRIECYKSNQDEVLKLIKKYFSQATIISTMSTTTTTTTSSSQEEINSVVNLVIELKDSDNNSKDNLEENLINMLEYFESYEKEKLDEKMGIKSYSLKSSSIEDVMINTASSDIDNNSTANKQVNGDKNNLNDSSSFKLKINTTNESINTLITTNKFTCSSTNDDDNFKMVKLQLNLLKALLIKLAQVYKKDLVIIIYVKIILAIISSLFLNCNFLNFYITSSYKPSFMICYMVIHFIHYPAQERISKLKIIQLTSKLSILTYWLGHFIMDLIFILFIMITLNNFFFSLLFNGIYIESKSTIHLIITASTFLYGLSAAVVAYYLSTFMKDVKTAPGKILLFYWMGCIASFVINILSLIWIKFFWLHNIADYLFILIIPGDAFQYIMSGLVAECYIGPKLGKESIPCTNDERFSRILIGFFVLKIQIFVYGSLLYLKESQNGNIENGLLKTLKGLIFFSIKKTNSFNIDNSSITKEIDDDVLIESSRAAEAIARRKQQHQQLQQQRDGTNLVLIANELSKSYKKGVKVVDNLSFTVNRGECFGLLGINGAGKSTTFSMLTNDEISHDSGQICIMNSFEPKEYRKQIGFTPQTNPDTVLTPSELFHLMARLRGVSDNNNNLSRLVGALLDLLQMEEHAHKKCKELSGGNKRKLTLGMALIANPSFVILDEATSGVDPIARIDIWSLLRALKEQNNLSVLLSSHAMEECEAICDRIAIMASGNLRCIGSFLHLRSKFSQASRLRIQVTKSEQNDSELENFVKDVVVKELCEKFQSQFGRQVSLVDTNINSATFDINTSTFNINSNVTTISRSTLFKLLRQFKQKYPNVHYMFNDSSLEDIFIALAQEQHVRKIT